MRLRIAAIQMPVTADIGRNAKHILSALEQAAADRADLLLTPEGSLSGYTSRFDRNELCKALATVTDKARALGTGLALGTCSWEDDGLCYNQIRVYLPDGALAGFHAKILRCAPLDNPEAGELAEYAAAPLRAFEWKGASFGCLICNDLWATPGYTTVPNPYLAWALKKLGCRFILHAVNNGEKGRFRPYHEANLSLWAFSLKVPIVTVNAPPAKGFVNSLSGVMGPDGEWLCQAPEAGAQYFSYDLSL
jgi:predicted amidohydrolase